MSAQDKIARRKETITASDFKIGSGVTITLLDGSRFEVRQAFVEVIDDYLVVFCEHLPEIVIPTSEIDVVTKTERLYTQISFELEEEDEAVEVNRLRETTTDEG